MSTRHFVRDLAFIAAALVLGWWAHGAGSTVHAQRNNISDSHSSSDNLLFQYGSMGPDGQLTLYNSSNRTLYIYPSVTRASSSQINCLYSVHVDHPGGALERTNCGVGSFPR